jgi:hypothetical protein
MRVSKSHTQTTELLYLKPYTYTVVQNLQDADCVLRLWFCYFFCEAVCSDEVKALLSYFANEALFYVSSHVNIENNGYWSAANPSTIHVPIDDIRVEVSAASIVRHSKLREVH